ncbi:MAG: LemA family protein [Candidatus Sumerlaeia bacterium]
MTGAAIVLIVIVALFAIVILWVIGIYNGLVRLRNIFREAWAQIDVQLKRRHDLIPNLVETVKGYAGHERQTLEAVIQARSAAVSAKGVEQQAQAEAGLSGALGKLMLLVEQYPNLKANENFLALQEELTATENRIGFARQHYNDSVMQYNTSTQSFPNNIIAGMFNFAEQPFFQIEDAAERQAPQVKF